MTNAVQSAEETLHCICHRFPCGKLSWLIASFRRLVPEITDDIESLSCRSQQTENRNSVEPENREYLAALATA